MDDLIQRVEALEAKFAQMDLEFDVIQEVHQNKERINNLAHVVAILTRTVKVLLIAAIGAALIFYGDLQLQDSKLGNDEPGLWMSRIGMGVVAYSVLAATNQEAIVMSNVLSWMSAVNPWKK